MTRTVREVTGYLDALGVEVGRMSGRMVRVAPVRAVADDLYHVCAMRGTTLNRSKDRTRCGGMVTALMTGLTRYRPDDVLRVCPTCFVTWEEGGT